VDFIELQDIHKTYHMGDIDVPVLHGITLKIAHGEFVALMGASGSGKSTLMHIMGCLDHATSGRFWLDGEDVSKLSADRRAMVRNRKIGFVFQSFNLLARTTALDNVAMPLGYTAGHLSERQARQRAAEVLERVGLADRMRHEPSKLSGGQQQRVAIARALVNRPPVLLCDEPTGNLDSESAQSVTRLFVELAREQDVCVIMVTHNLELAGQLDGVRQLRDGLLGEAES